jgi:hypothetical protein
MGVTGPQLTGVAYVVRLIDHVHGVHTRIDGEQRQMAAFGELRCFRLRQM